MATSKTSNSIQFVVGKPVFVWKTTGAKEGKNGPTTSERTGQDYPDIEPTEPLLVLVKYGTNKALAQRQGRDGEKDEKIIVHHNHINPNSPYYANRAAKEAVKPLTPAQELAQAQAEAEAAMARLQKAKDSIPAPTEAEPEIEVTPVVSAEDRGAASALFADA